MRRLVPDARPGALILLALAGTTSPATAQLFRGGEDDEGVLAPAATPARATAVTEPDRVDANIEQVENRLEALRTAQPLERSTSRAALADRTAALSVTQRRHPELDPLGVRLGGFTLYPEATLAGLADGNMLRQRDGVFDVALVGTGRLRARSNWRRHALSADLRTSYRSYASQTTENVWQYRLSGTGQLDVGRTSSITATVLRAREIIQRGAAGENLITRNPVRVFRTQGEVTGRSRQGRFGFELSASALRSNFADAVTPDGLPAPQDFRDNVIVGGVALVDYHIAPETSAFVSLGYDLRDFDVDNGPVRRDSRSVEALAGVRGTLTPLVRGRIGLGVISENYKSPAVRDFSALAIDARVEWLVTPLTTLTALARRQVGNAAIASSPAYLSTRFGLRADHELLRNLTLNAAASHEIQDFRLSPRKDRVIAANVGADWIPNRRWLVQLRGTYRGRDSSGVTNPRTFDDFELTLGVTSRL